MGVPAFYRWLTEKYPKIIQDVLEERVKLAPNSHSVRLPYDSTTPNPSGLECDNLYIDMNGIIHPCSHPENGPQPNTEEEMYENVCKYIDRLFRIMRPRKLLYLAIDGVAPRAKMNQQRSRRFRSAQEARELAELEEHVRTELIKTGQRVPPAKHAWDSNVITPGTPFMINLAEYIRFYIRKRISTDKAWKAIRVIFSDASLPGEGEHKIMSHIRLQRSQPGYNPNLVHVLHGLDADLIMLALATHEAHFYISREEVLFGRKSQEQQEQRQLESGYKDAQRILDDNAGDMSMQLLENTQKPIQRVSIPILREYLSNEFKDCITRVPFEPSLERLIDDIVFMCFFVGNDFLPHLPSLDIRDGALDFLFNVYKRILPGLGDYITKSGGKVNLSHVDVLLAEVGSIEDYVFTMKYENEERERKRREEQKANRKNNNPNAPPPIVGKIEHHKVRGRAAKILGKNEEDAIALSSRKHPKQQQEHNMLKVSHKNKNENAQAAAALKEALMMGGNNNNNDIQNNNKEDENNNSSGKKRSRDEIEKDNDKKDGTDVDTDNGNEPNAEQNDKNMKKKDSSIVGDIEEEFDADDNDDDDVEAEIPKIEDIDETVDPEAAKHFKEKVKAAQSKKLEEYAKNVDDKVRLHEKGWKDRYYKDKCKADDVRNHGGRDHLFRSYVVGLCWVMKYYYDGCPSWKWFYPFHYAPFASDLKNIERFEKDCRSFQLSLPFNPVEQLMAVLPSDSAHAIPKAARWLMKDPESPIIDFYPTDVPVDPNGKAMPWLWVVLLPFIDEDRLLAAMSPTMTKWTKGELFCNARGLDDGYLYIHRDNPLSKKFAIVLKEGCTAKDPKTKLTDAASYGCAGFSGAVRPPLSNELYPVGEHSTVQPPSTASKIDDGESLFADKIDPNDSVCVAFTEPPKLSHKSILLPGVQLAPPVLTDADKVIRRPRLNRGGGSIANLGVSNGQSYKSGHGSMNISTYERNLAMQTGRGHEMYQTGNRAWGAMEPVPKRRNIQQQSANQFGRQSGYAGPPPNQPYPPQASYQNQRYQQNNWNAHQQQSGAYPGHANPPQQQYRHGYNEPHGGPPPQGYQQQQYAGGSYQQQQPNQNRYQGSGYQQQGYQNSGRPGGFSGPPPNYNRPGPPPPPPPQQQQQGFNFRSYNQGANPNYQQRGGFNQQNDSRRSRASAEVMNNLRAQLTNTLNRNRGQNNNRR